MLAQKKGEMTADDTHSWIVYLAGHLSMWWNPLM